MFCDRQKKTLIGKFSQPEFEVQTIAIRSEFLTVKPQTQTQVFGGLSHSKKTDIRHKQFTVLTDEIALEMGEIRHRISHTSCVGPQTSSSPWLILQHY